MIHEVQTRWQDFDGLGHVHHAAVLHYLEEGRDEFLRRCEVGPTEYVVGRCTVTYLREIRPETRSVPVECTVVEVGRSSFRTHERIFDPNGEVAVEAEFGLVMWDSATSSSRPISDEERNAMTRTRPGGDGRGGGA